MLCLVIKSKHRRHWRVLPIDGKGQIASGPAIHRDTVASSVSFDQQCRPPLVVDPLRLHRRSGTVVRLIRTQVAYIICMIWPLHSWSDPEVDSSNLPSLKLLFLPSLSWDEVESLSLASMVPVTLTIQTVLASTCIRSTMFGRRGRRSSSGDNYRVGVGCLAYDFDGG